MSKRPSLLPTRDTIKLFFTLGFLGALWIAVISELLENPPSSGTQWTSLGVLAVLTVLMIIFLERTSKHGLLAILKSIKRGRNAPRGDETDE